VATVFERGAVRCVRGRSRSPCGGVGTIAGLVRG